MWLENTCRLSASRRNFKFQSFFFWMWLENWSMKHVRRCPGRRFNPSSSGCGWKTPAPKRTQYFHRCFNPSSSGCGWKTLVRAGYGQRRGWFQSFFFWMWLENIEYPEAVLVWGTVSILLLLDVAGKRFPAAARLMADDVFQSFFFWMWLENTRIAKPYG